MIISVNSVNQLGLVKKYCEHGCFFVVVVMPYTIAVTTLHASRSRKDFTRFIARLLAYRTALLAVLRYEFLAVLTRPGSVVRAAA
jgi:hypothetical protein